MANTFYSYLAFITPTSDASLIALKNNLETFYERPVIENKPEILVEDNQINNNYEISISCNESVKDDVSASQPFVELRNNMQKYFANNKIILKLVVNDLDNVVKRIE